MLEEFEVEEEGPKGLPGWMATFADMMALLMCFFVLLLAYSDMNVEKFKRIAGAMKDAFGVQNEINIEETPKGTDVIFDKFQPGTPEPTPIKQIEQATVDSSEKELLRQEQERLALELLQQKRQELERKNEKIMAHLRKELDQELKQGVLELEMLGQQIVFRIRERGSFSSASAFLQPRFKPVVMKIARLVHDIPGQILVEGHTDNQPVARDMFENNWDLSAKRAVAVASQMLRVAELDSSRLTVTGHAANQPLMQGNSILARQKNRRVEIIVVQGKPKELEALEMMQQKP